MPTREVPLHVSGDDCVRPFWWLSNEIGLSREQIAIKWTICERESNL